MSRGIDIPSTRLHLVSQVVLARFCGPGSLLVALDVEHPRSKPLPRSPRAVAFTEELKPARPDVFESLWKPVEDRLRSAIDSVENGTIFDEPRYLETIRDCLALHWARSNTMERATRTARDQALAEEERQLEGHPELVSREGLAPAGPEGRRWVAKQRITYVAATQFRHEVMAPERMMYNFEKAREILRGRPLEVAVATEGEFIIGDTPAHTFDPNLGVDVPLLEAKGLMMPLGRWHSVGMSVMTGYSDFPKELVDFQNGVQVTTAVKRVMWHPDADMVDFVRSNLTEG